MLLANRDSLYSFPSSLGAFYFISCLVILSSTMLNRSGEGTFFILYLIWEESIHSLGLPGWFSGKESACNARDTGDVGLIPGSGRSPGGGNGNLPPEKNPTDRGASQVTVQRVANSWTWLSTHSHIQSLTDVSCRFFVDCYLSVQEVPSTASWLNVFIIKVLGFVKYFPTSIKMIVWFLSLIPLIWCIILIDFHVVNQPCIVGVMGCGLWSVLSFFFLVNLICYVLLKILMCVCVCKNYWSLVSCDVFRLIWGSE